MSSSSSSSKNELKIINMIKPPNLNSLNEYFELILNEDEKSFKKCLETIIYTSKISDSVTIELNHLFKTVRDNYTTIV